MYYLNFLIKSPEKKKPKQRLGSYSQKVVNQVCIKMVKNGRELKVLS